AIAKSIELLDIAEPKSGLLLDPGAQADLEGAVRDGVEGAEGKAGEPVAVAAGGGEDQRFIVLDRNNRRGQADLDRRQKLVAHLAPANFMAVIRARRGTACLRPSSSPARSRRARGPCGRHGRAPCRPG